MARQRNFNGNPSPVVIPNGRGNQPDDQPAPTQPEHRRQVGFGANMDTGRMTQYFNDGSQETHYNTPAEQMFDQIGQVIQRGQSARQQKRQMDDAALASALVYSKQNNGFMPPDMTEAISQQLGIPVAGGNFAGNGDYIIYGRKQIQSQNGKVRGEQIVPIAIANPEMQFRVLQRSGLGQSMQEELYDAMRAKSKLTEQQLSDRGIIDPRLRFAQNPANAKNARALMSGRGGGDAGAGGGKSAKDMLNDISAMQKYMSDNAETMDDSTRSHMTTALGNAMKMLTSQYLPQSKPDIRADSQGRKWEVVRDDKGKVVGKSAVEDDGNIDLDSLPEVSKEDAQTQTQEPQVSEDGVMMKLMDGRTIRKDQEFEVEGPNGQKLKFIWRGGDARNVEKVN